MQRPRGQTTELSTFALLSRHGVLLVAFAQFPRAWFAPSGVRISLLPKRTSNTSSVHHNLDCSLRRHRCEPVASNAPLECSYCHRVKTRTGPRGIGFVHVNPSCQSLWRRWSCQSPSSLHGCEMRRHLTGMDPGRDPMDTIQAFPREPTLVPQTRECSGASLRAGLNQSRKLLLP